MPDTPANDPALALVHEGWAHLKSQRPVAAWASWRRALRDEPEHKAALHALDVLASAGDLPEAARVDRNFLKPRDEATRARWDIRLLGRDLGDLDVAAWAFGSLASEDPADGRARFNQGLCLAWSGRNAEAVAALGMAVVALAAEEFDRAVDAWALAEILRQGGGAEAIADDLNHVALFTWPAGEDPSGFLDLRDDVRPVPAPTDPVTGQPRLSDARIYEWLDRHVAPSPEVPTIADVRRVRATAIRLPRTLRLSSPDPIHLEEVREDVARITGDRSAETRRQASPLPLAFLDAAVWAIRMPPGIEPDDEDRLNRGRRRALLRGDLDSPASPRARRTHAHRSEQEGHGRRPRREGQIDRRGPRPRTTGGPPDHRQALSGLPPSTASAAASASRRRTSTRSTPPTRPR